MKKLLYLCTLVLFALMASFSKAKAYNITYHYAFDSCTRGNFWVQVSDSSGTSMLETSYGDGTTDTNTISYGFISYGHPYTSSGSYTVKMVWIRAGVRVDSLTFTFTHAACGYITGRLYHDKNSNCAYDLTDVPLFAYNTVAVDSAGYPIDTIFAYSTFTYRVFNSGVTYSFSVASTTSGLTPSCPSTGIISATSSLGSSVAAGDFGFQCASSSSFDAVAHLVTHTGRHSDYIYVTLTSNSCTAKSGTLTVNFDSHYTYYNSSPSGASHSGHTVTFSYSNLSIDSPRYFTVRGETSPWLIIGTHISNTVYIDALTGDTDHSNDTVTNADTVTGSWDPNDKQVSPQGNIAAGTNLTYTLSFENTGNAPAKNIHILDTLDANLDLKTMQVITSSFPVRVYTFKNIAGGRTVIRFDFVNINLLDSTHHGECDGFVMYSINAKKGLSAGTSIPNRAGIYFDDNEVVMTNTVMNTIHPLAVPVLNTTAHIAVYPNPVNDELTINTGATTYEQVIIINSLGQTVMQQSVQSTEVHVNVKSLVPGMYYIMLKGANGVKVEKIEKL